MSDYKKGLIILSVNQLSARFKKKASFGMFHKTFKKNTYFMSVFLNRLTTNNQEI